MLATLIAAGALEALLASSLASTSQGPPCVSAAEQRSIDRLVDAGEPARAIEVAQEVRSRCPADPGARLLLARAQIRAGDLVGARATLEEDLTPGSADCERRGWLIWLDIEEDFWENARARLDAAGCPQTEAEQGRWTLLEALLARAEGDVGGFQWHLEGLSERQPLLPEDEDLDATLRWRHLQELGRPFEATLEIGLGGTSNAFAASPVDAARRDPVASATARPAAAIRVRAPAGAVTPVVEARASGVGLASDEARNRSNATVSIRAGAWFGRRPKLRPLLAFAHEEVLLNLPDRSRYATANRAEVEVSGGRRLTLLAGVGRRTFHTDEWRTRTEWDGGAILGLSSFGRPLLLAGSFRLFHASRPVHDQIGATLTAATELPIRSDLSARLVAACAFDDFPHSGGQDGAVAFGTTERRRDTLVRLSAGLWRRLSAHVVAGATYDFAQRWSTADAPGIRYYPYVDHRLLLTLRLELGANPWRRHPRRTSSHVRLPYADLEQPPVLLDDLVRGLLRQQDELIDDCGDCVVP